MPNVNQVEQGKDDHSSHQRQAINTLVREQVIHALGTPRDLLDVQVRKLWNDHYRVNVLVGLNSGSVRVAHSYFVVTDSSGSVITATPKIAKLY